MSYKKIKKYKQKHRKNFGDIAEWTIENFLSANGQLLRKRNHHFDMIFENLIHVEVKATQLGVLRTGYKVRRVNHGWTLLTETHKQLLKEKYGFYALVLMIDEEIIHFRFLRATKALNNLTNSLDYTKKPRIRLGTLYKSLTPMEFLEEVEKIKEDHHGQTNTQNHM